MNIIYLNNREVYKSDIDLMDLPELNKLMCEVQEEIHKSAIKKTRLATLPKSKKDGKTLTKLRKCSERLMYLQDAVNYISNAKKAKRDNQSKERDFYKLWVQKAQLTLRKSLYEKIEAEVTAELGYGRL